MIFSTHPYCGSVAADEGNRAQSLLELPIEQLMELTVTTVSKHEQRAFEAAAAIDVITAKEIRRAGITTLPEAIRLATGVQMASSTTNQYSISIRRPPEIYSDKLLVMIDGRKVYTPTFSGVWWPSHEYPLEDIDRIEVVRGPGATLWGSNAVSGVINIITKHTSDTAGWLADAHAGDEEKGKITLRYGGGDEDASYRAYGMVSERDGGIGISDRMKMPDSRKLYQAGFRTDHNKVGRFENVRLSGDIYNILAGSRTKYFDHATVSKKAENVTDHYQGQNLVLSGTHNQGSELATSLEATYWGYRVGTRNYTERRETLTAEVKTDYTGFSGNRIIAGVETLFSFDDFDNTPTLKMDSHSYSQYSLFIRDEITFAEKGRFIIGSKFEKNPYTGWETQPETRLAWLEENWTVWGMAARSSRIPNRVEEALVWDIESAGQINGLPSVARIIGDGRVKSERVTAYEGGYRYFRGDFLFDVSLYKHTLDGRKDSSLATQDAFLEDNYIVVPLYLENIHKVDTSGVETMVKASPADWLDLKFAHTYIDVNFELLPGKDTAHNRDSRDFYNKLTPKNRYAVYAFIDLPGGVEWDTVIYQYDSFSDVVPMEGNRRLDMRIAWNPSADLTVALIGHNLQNNDHFENSGSFTEENARLQRSLLARVTYRF